MRYLITLTIVAYFACYANARHICEDEARSIAREFMNNTSIMLANGGNEYKANAPGKTAQKSNAPYYAYNVAGNNGFVIVSGDDRTGKILGYSDHGAIDFDNLPPQLSYLLDTFTHSISSIKTRTSNSAPGNEIRSTNGKGVLLKTVNWGQEYPYNTQCPTIDGVQSPTGCVATAMAIVMKYHNWPERGRYKWVFKRGGISVDFSKSEYRFNSYKDSYNSDSELTDDVKNLAHLFTDLGSAVIMGYNKESSSANPHTVGYVLTRFFKYSPQTQFLIKRDFTDEQWNRFIVDNLDKSQPVIYNASTEDTGHSFVIDGYQDNFYHINWGWDGRANGYFALSEMNPSGADGGAFVNNHSMIADIKPDPDYAKHEFSEIWLDSGADRGEDWMPEWYKDTLRGMGMGIDCSEVKSGEPFNIITECIHVPTSYAGEIGIALMDKDDRVVKILRSVQIENKEDSPALGSFPYYYEHLAYEWKELVYDGTLTQNMYLQLASKKEGSDEWLKVNGTPLTPSWLPVSGNIPTVVKSIVNMHGTDPDEGLVEYYTDLARIGQQVENHFNCCLGVAHLYINNKYYGTLDDFRFKAAEPEEGDDPFGRPETEAIRYVDIYYTPQNSLLSKTIENIVPGTLANRLEEEDKMNLYRLKITGTLSNDDINTLYTLRALGELDLSEANIEGDELTEWLPYLRVLNLPRSLKKISYDHDYYRDHSVSIVNVPENMTDCGNLHARDFIVFNSMVPPSANYESIQLELEHYNMKVPTVVIVPPGSKSAYEQHPHWKHFDKIIEMKPGDFFDASVNADGNYLYCNITDNISSLTNSHKFTYTGDMIFKDENFRFPFRYAEIPSIAGNKDFTFIKRMCINDGTSFNGRNFYYLPSDGFFTGFNYNGEQYALQYIISEALQPNFSKLCGYVLVPAHSKIGKMSGAEDEYQNRIYSRFEMFGLYCDKVSNHVFIVPKLEGVEIEQVKINGMISMPDGLKYNADFSKDVEIEVSYNFKGLHNMITTYSPEIVAELPHDPNPDLSAIKLFNDSGDNDTISIYDMSGYLIYNGSIRLTPRLSKGIYLVVNGLSSHKILIE